MTDIRQIEQSIIRPMLMIELKHMIEKKASPKTSLINDILVGIFIALVIMQ